VGALCPGGLYRAGIKVEIRHEFGKPVPNVVPTGRAAEILVHPECHGRLRVASHRHRRRCCPVGVALGIVGVVGIVTGVIGVASAALVRVLVAGVVATGRRVVPGVAGETARECGGSARRGEEQSSPRRWSVPSVPHNLFDRAPSERF